MGIDQEPPYQGLIPDLILAACESLGLSCDGRLLALNSYENRVYRIGIEDGAPVVAKFYRPGRWADEAILEEHSFTQALVEADIPVVAPLSFSGGDETLFHFEGFRFAIYPLQPGRWRELEDEEDLRCLGRLMARIHNCGARESFGHRPRLTVERLGHESLRYILDQDLLPLELLSPYRVVVEQCLEKAESVFDAYGQRPGIRLHGDCHLGNILWADRTPFFVDLDDCLTGPAVQDLWMLLSGDYQQRSWQINTVLEGYEVFRTFDPAELGLIEVLRSLRMLNYAAWLARRWSDPAFPLNFPWFNTQKYWEEQILSFKGQLAEMSEPSLQRHP